MATPRANWKGVLKIGAIECGVALYTAASTAERMSFHILNRKTGHRVHRRFVDAETGRPVEHEDQIKGYETGRGDYIPFEPEEIEKAVPDADKILEIQAFVTCGEVDDIYFDRPYYLATGTPADNAAFDLMRDGMRDANVAAIARTVLFRRVRSVLIRAQDKGLIATTLNFDYEIRSADDAFGELPFTKVDKEMLDLAQHIIKTKKGRFDPRKFDDRYEAAVEELVKAKMEGRKIVPPQRPVSTPDSDLLEALRQSAGGKSDSSKSAPTKTKARKPARRKAA
jgi:DNA end-binding protein Ku